MSLKNTLFRLTDGSTAFEMGQFQKQNALGEENMLHVELRPEQPTDCRETESVTRAAFWNRYVPGCNEHYLVHVMRHSPDFVPGLDVVAVHNGAIVGHVAYAKALIRGDDGEDREVLTLGPISVLPEHQRQGVGGALIEHTARLARDMGFRAVLLCGDPAYYGRRGFVPAESFGIRTADDMYAAALQVRELRENALVGVAGRYVESSLYEIDESAAAEFDATFPPREKISGTPSQKRFEQLVALRRSAD